LPEIRAVYDAQVAISWLIASISGAVLSLTSILLLFFYIRKFIDQHKPELGVLKALGYKNWEIARKFWLFSLPIGLGTSIGYFSSFVIAAKHTGKSAVKGNDSAVKNTVTAFYSVPSYNRVLRITP